MLIQQEKKPPVTSHATDVQLLAGAEKVVEVKQPGIALRIGTALDPGIERNLPIGWCISATGSREPRWARR
jgi:hypothetical protein